MTITGYGIPATEYTLGGLPSADTPMIKKLAGNPDKGEYGEAYQHLKKMGREQEGKELCEALQFWLNYKAIDTLLATYIIPL